MSPCCRKHGSQRTNDSPNANLYHAFFERVRRPSADGADDRLRFLTGMPVGPVAWMDASTASSGASAIFSATSEIVLQTWPFFGKPRFGHL